MSKVKRKSTTAELQAISGTKFWGKQVAAAVVVIVVAFGVLYIRGESQQSERPIDEPEDKSIDVGLSRFYKEFRASSSDPLEEYRGDFVVPVETPKEPIHQRLRNMTSENFPVRERWTGEFKYRTFQPGNTLRNVLGSYAAEEGMQLIWELPEDFVIKHTFQIEGTVLQALAEVADGVNNQFEGRVRGYYCPEQRSIVITDTVSEFLYRECRVVS